MNPPGKELWPAISMHGRICRLLLLYLFAMECVAEEKEESQVQKLVVENLVSHGSKLRAAAASKKPH